MKNTIRVALGQMESRPSALAHNLSVAERWAAQAASEGASLLVLPELFDWGYDLAGLERQGPSPLSLGCGSWAKSHGLSVVAGIALSQGGARNASVHFRPEGGHESYAKVHLFEAEPNVESRVFQPGQERALWRIAGHKASPLICYDLRFPELARAAALDGAEMLVASSAWPASRREVFRVLCQARAIENQCFVVSANLCGSSAAGSFAGHSLVVAPDGTILGEAGEGQSLLLVDLDFSLVQKARSFLPCFQQRQPAVYSSSPKAN